MIKRFIEKLKSLRLYFISSNTYDIKDLEDRCRKANFAPYDDKLTIHEFVWDEHTIEIAENWLRQHHPEFGKPKY
jgi:hypothetical protein